MEKEPGYLWPYSCRTSELDEDGNPPLIDDDGKSIKGGSRIEVYDDSYEDKGLVAIFKYTNGSMKKVGEVS